MTSTVIQFLLTYVLGGCTFIPLVVYVLWLALPKLEDAAQQQSTRVIGREEDDEDTKEKLKRSREEGEDTNGTASGSFAVLRKYDLPAATAALTARHGGHHASGAGNGVDGAHDGVAGSESVYQSMYRSVFDRSRTTTPPAALNNTSDDEGTTTADAKTRRKASKPVPANVFYIVLRHGHLMLYDSPTQIEVRHVISLAHHKVSMSDGEEETHERDPITDGDLFIKRTAILLTPLAVIANGALQAHATPQKPFYLFTTTSILKESFYHALVLASPREPAPQPLDPHDMIKLQTTLHSTVITAETRALNAVMSRIFLALSGTDQLRDFFRAKVEKKISRVQKPGFINTLSLQAIELGTTAPVLANLRLKDLNISGDVTISCDVRYTGGISLTLAAQAKLDLGPRFKTRTVDLLLSSSLKRLSGHMLIRVKPPPTNRLWFCFDGMPDMEIKIEPVVSTRQITYGFILRQIEEKIRAVVSETLVRPNWDDISFFDTRGQETRGGLWAKVAADGSDGTTTPTDADMLAKRGEKTMSMPALRNYDAEVESVSSGTEALREQNADLKRRSVASLPVSASPPAPLATIHSEEGASTQQPSRPLRSPSFAAPSTSSPSVALDDSSAQFDPLQKPPPQKARTWGRRHLASPPTRKEAVDAMREMRDRSLNVHSGESAPRESDSANDQSQEGVSDDDAGSFATVDRAGTGLSTMSTASSASASTKDTTASSKSDNARRRNAANLLTAATNATTAAKNWSWNALQNRAAKNAAGKDGIDAFSSQEPMGRGQPLPPPGTPLPGPQAGKSLWSGSGFAVPGLSGSLKRKPLLPRRPVEKAQQEQVASIDAGKIEQDEFGDWAENSGNGGEAGRESLPQQNEPSVPREKANSPPLPKRRRAKSESEGAVANSNPQHNVPSQAQNAASLAASSSAKADAAAETSNTSGDTPEHVATGPATSSLDTGSKEPNALPAKPAPPEDVQQNSPSNSDPEDLVVVATPVESGRTTPIPAAPSPSRDARAATPSYDGREWGTDEDDDERNDDAARKSRRGGHSYGGDEEGDEDDYEEEEDDDEGMPKASFSRSRDDGFDLHQ